MFHRGFCNPVYLQDYRMGVANIDKTRLVLPLDNNIEREQEGFTGLLLQYVKRFDFIFRKSRFPHLEVIRRSARGITRVGILWHWTRT